MSSQCQEDAEKTKLGAKNLLFPTPTVLVGAKVNAKPNYITVAHCGIVALTHISISLRKGRYTSCGIKGHGTFIVNIPSAEMVMETDYCGMVSVVLVSCRFAIAATTWSECLLESVSASVE